MLNEEASLRGKIGAARLHATHDSREITAAARAAWFQKFIDEVDPDRVLPEFVRLKRAEHARDAYMYRLSLKSVKARRLRREQDAPS